jgi:metallo-beta-lactamase family protein
VGFQAQGTLGRFLVEGVKAVRVQGCADPQHRRILRSCRRPRTARWIAARRPIQRGLFLIHGEEPALTGLSERVAERIVPSAKVFTPILDDIYELSTPAPSPIDVSHRRRLAPEAVVALDWHNDMSKLILDVND